MGRAGRANSFVGLILTCFVPGLRAQDVLVEAEAFSDPGGWVLDQQFMDQMGSPYLLAHGLGVPVSDATTTVSFPGKGPYRVWVRTRDWALPREGGEAPGRFQVLLNGTPIGGVFGTEGAEWHWQDGGTVEVAKGPVAVGLRDLTGFEGRVDAVLFASDPSFVPPDAGEKLAAFRRKALGFPGKPEDGGRYDLVVAGGGIAGMCAAISAARHGLKVALVQDRPVLGGNNSSEVRVWLGGETNKEPYPRIGDVVKELEPGRRAHAGPDNTAGIYEDARRLDLLRAERNIVLVLDHRVVAVEKKGDALTGVVAQDIRTGRRRAARAGLFADCTGDGAVGALAGADFEATEKGHMGPSNLWHVADTGAPAPFPRCPWAVDLAGKPFPGRGKNTAQWSEPELKSLGQWFWECGYDWDPENDVERMRDWNLRAMYGAWDALKNVDGLYPNHRLNWAAYITGKRESRRLMGDAVPTRDDILSGREFEDACFPCTWSIDLHAPHPRYAKGFEGREFISQATHDPYRTPYWLPYRSLYSRNIPNLFMAGRDISVTHDALGIVRVMRTCGMMGEVVGMAAALCVVRGTTPRGVYKGHLGELKEMLRRGVPRGKTKT
jgi:hypothetical protein